MNPSPRQFDDELVNLGLALILGGAVVLGVLRLAGSIAARLTGAVEPRGAPGRAIGVIADPLAPGAALGSPGLSPVIYWLVVTVLITLVGLASWSGWRVFAVVRDASSLDRRHLAGVATHRDVTRAASESALLNRARNLRPSMPKPIARDVGYLLGHARRCGVWSSVEDSTLILGPPRSGKGLHLVVNAILDAPGAVVTTATRPDNIAITLAARREHGPVAIFDPQHLAEGLPHGLRWSPVRGCEDPLTAMIRATGLASATGLSGGGVESGGFWEGKTRTALQALLHAAALDRRTPAELLSWTLAPSAAADAVAILASRPDAATGWAESLDSMIESDPRTRDSIWMGVSLALSALADPRVLDTVSPTASEAFDPTTFLKDNGTLYLLATGAGAGASWPLVAALIEDLVETARHLAARSQGARLDPPLLLALDEIGNLAPSPRSPPSWPKAVEPASPPCPSYSRYPRHATSGASIPPTPSGTPRSSRSSSAAPPPPATSKTSPPSSANETNAPTRSRSATTAPGGSNGPPAAYRSSHPTRSAPSRSVPDLSCSDPRRRSSPIYAAGLTAPTASVLPTSELTPSNICAHPDPGMLLDSSTRPASREALSRLHAHTVALGQFDIDRPNHMRGQATLTERHRI